MSVSTLDPALDWRRLAKQRELVLLYVMAGKWLTLSALEGLTGCPQASISARLRDLRADGYLVERRRKGAASSGLWEYRVTAPDLFTPKPVPKVDAVAELRAALAGAHEALARAHQALKDAGLPLPGEGE